MSSQTMTGSLRTVSKGNTVAAVFASGSNVYLLLATITVVYRQMYQSRVLGELREAPSELRVHVARRWQWFLWFAPQLTVFHV